MAKTREIRNRLKSVASTMKITRTMEMVATVRSKRAQDRLRGALPFYEHLAEMAGRLVEAGAEALHPLFRRAETPRRAVVLLITSDRGLCGGYNAHAIAAGRQEVRALQQQGIEHEFHVAGKKGIGFFRFLGWEMQKTLTGIDDRVRFEDLDDLAREYMDRFRAEEIDEVRVVGHQYISSTQQKATTFRLLPVDPPAHAAEEEEEGGESRAEFEFMPSAGTILEALVPFEVKTALFTRFLEAGTSEQIARRVAMKLATDNAEEMVKTLRQRYNRARQTQITTELSDIMGGAAAISK
jgi:F-type H+-transporting ATPase subunit gamma